MLKNYLDVNNIPVKNITTHAEYGAPNMMKKKLFKIEKKVRIQKCFLDIRRENLVIKNILHVLSEILNSVIKCINDIMLMPNVSISSSYFVKNKIQTM